MTEKMKDMSIQEWHDKQFVPWKQAVAGYLAEKNRQKERLHQHVGQLQTIVALLLDGKPRQAMQAWNALGLNPLLKDIDLSRDGEHVTLTEPNGKVHRLLMDDVVDDLQRLLDERDAAGATPA